MENGPELKHGGCRSHERFARCKFNCIINAVKAYSVSAEQRNKRE